MAQADSNNTTTLGSTPGLARRDFIVGAALAVPAVAAAPMAAMASSGVDPIFALIEGHRAAVKTRAAAAAEVCRREGILMEQGIGLNPFISVLDVSGTYPHPAPIVAYRHEYIDQLIPADRFSEANSSAHASLDAQIERHKAIMGDSGDISFDAANAESEALDTIIWTGANTVGGAVALLEWWGDVMNTTPDVLFADQNEALISSIADLLRDLHPNA